MRKMIIAIALILCIGSLFAQQTGNIEGVVVDSNTGEKLPGVNIILKGTYYGAATDINGKYRINGITVGNYNVSISLIGYTTVEYTAIEIEPNKTKQIDVNLDETVLTLNQEVVVIGDKPLMDVEETQSKRTVTREDIEVTVVENIQGIVSRQTGVVESDREIHIRGGRTYENAYLIDGVSVQDPLAGTGFGLQLSANAIEQVEVITGGYNAEYGQATSGVVNVTTREGKDNFSGSVSYKRDNFGNLDSYNVFNTDILELTLSGPEPITSFILPAIGLDIPGNISFFSSFYTGLTDGITQGYYKPTADQLYSSTFNGTDFAPRAENSWFWLLKFTYRYSPTLKFGYSFNSL